MHPPFAACCCFAELFAKAIDEIGPEKVAAICTDGAAAMTKGRRDLVSQPKYRHILDLRCQMHAFNLLYGSFFGHPVPKSIMRTAQQIVMFVRASHKVGELVRQKAREMGKKVAALKTSNKTRFTSGEASLSSIAELVDVLQSVYVDAPALFQHKPELVAVLSDRWHDFWRQLREFVKLLLPISSQGRSS
ncbi:unnamed protein product [Phaeothamnion confervicola]